MSKTAKLDELWAEGSELAKRLESIRKSKNIALAKYKNNVFKYKESQIIYMQRENEVKAELKAIEEQLLALVKENEK